MVLYRRLALPFQKLIKSLAAHRRNPTAIGALACTGIGAFFFILAAILGLAVQECYLKGTCSFPAQYSIRSAGFAMQTLGWVVLLVALPLWSTFISDSFAQVTRNLVEANAREWQTSEARKNGANINPPSNNWTGRAEPAGVNLNGVEACSGCGAAKPGRFCGNCGR